MIFAAVGDTLYDIFLVLHIAAVIAAFAPVIAHPLMSAQVKELDPQARGTVLGFIAANSQRVYGSALILVGVLGFGLVGLSDNAWEFGQGWLLASIILWIVMVGILHGFLVPQERALAAGDADAESKIAAGGGALTLLALAMLWLMVAKPGL